MRLIEYKIKRIASPEEDQLNQWQIEIELAPSWFGRIVFGKHLPIKKRMIGSCLHWRWADGTRVNYLWSVWANNAIKKRVKKAGGVKYVNRRLGRKEDE